ncbi:MAG: DedA family protein [Parachlamydiales bacterium]|jgi:membrane protein DedA with SNARE-associated domain
MEAIQDHQAITEWLLSYGSIAIFFLLVLGIIALPVPEDTLMILTGILIAKGSLEPKETLLAAYAGSMCGITTSYFIGRSAGMYFINRFGSWVGLTPAKVEIAHSWFQKFGKWTLVVGYFIAGVRHFTGFFAGMTYLDFRQFALFAYTGAFIWVSTFVALGYFFGHYVFELVEDITFGPDLIMTTIIVLIFIGLSIFFHRKNGNGDIEK